MSQQATLDNATGAVDKREATCRARLALKGGTLHRIENDRGRMVFIVTRWNLTRELSDLGAVEQFVDRLEGVKGEL